ERVEQAERKIKLLEDDVLQRDHEIKSLSHKVAQLEDQLEASEKTAKDAVEKQRVIDVKLEHSERQVQRLEQERDKWEQKYEARPTQEAQERFKASQKELDELARSLENL
ncbi:hypothetical protein EXIGLDRAFT_668686, partial [Exidia glandulosa HHB12029]